MHLSTFDKRDRKIIAQRLRALREVDARESADLAHDREFAAAYATSRTHHMVERLG